MNKYKTNSQSAIGNRVSTNDVDELLDKFSHLIDPEYKKWFAKQFYLIGVSKVIEYARRADEGKQPAKLFCHYLKQHD